MIIRSLTTQENPFNSTQEIREWIGRRNREVTVNVEQIPFCELRCWHSEEDGSIRHDSGKFFSIVGIDVKTDYGTNNHWRQPIINQPEVVTKSYPHYWEELGIAGFAVDSEE